MLAISEPDEILIDEQFRSHIEGPVEQLNDLRAPLFGITPLSSVKNTGQVTARHWIAEGCQFIANEEDATVLHRSKAQAGFTEEFVLLNRCIYGALRGEILDFAMESTTTNVYLCDEGLPASTLSPRSSFQGILIPKSLIGYDPSRHPPVIRLSKSQMMSEILHNDFDHLFAGLLQRHVLDRTRFQRMLASIKVAIGSELQDGDVRRRAREAVGDLICRFIEERLDDPDLSTGLILRNFGVSRASLYRIFESRGGVRRYISERRVVRAVMELAEQPIERGKISMISEKWGFASLQRFNRSVRREFGVAPSALVNSAS